MQKKQNTNICEEAIQILKTVLLLEKAFAPAYVQRIVTGDTRFPLRNVNHKELETFGSLDGMFFRRVLGIIDYLIREKMLEVKNAQYGNLILTDKGEAFLAEPQDLIVEIDEIRQSWYEFELSMNLRKLRKDMAAENECEPFELFTNYTLSQIIRILPETMVELSQLPGMEAAEETIRILVLAEISRITEKIAIDKKTKIYTRAYYPSHRKVRKLFEAGMAPEEIARRQKVKLSTVEEYLGTLHEAGHVDLKPYIEETVDSKILHKAGKYFKETENARLKEAHEVLGVDYTSLRKARTYVAKVWEEALPYAS